MIYSLGLGQAVSLFCLWEDISNFFQLQETIIHANSFQYENTINQHQHTLSVSYMIQSIAAVSAGWDILYRVRIKTTYQGTPRR